MQETRAAAHKFSDGSHLSATRLPRNVDGRMKLMDVGLMSCLMISLEMLHLKCVINRCLSVPLFPLPTVTTVVFCEFDVFALSCQTGTLNIVSATLGRTNNTVCIGTDGVGTKPQSPFDTGSLVDTSCRLDVTSQVADFCNSNSPCTSAAYPNGPLLVSFYTTLPDPCGGTFKYTNVTYVCSSLPPPGELFGLIGYSILCI